MTKAGALNCLVTCLLNAASQPSRHEHPRILFAEDDGEIGYIVTEMLRAEGFDVTPVENGDDGAITFDNHPFHMLLTDVRMPGIKDGIDLATHVRQRSPGLPIVIVSGYAEDLGARLKNLGKRVTFLRKPFLFRELVSSVESALLSTATSVVIREISSWQV